MGRKTIAMEVKYIYKEVGMRKEIKSETFSLVVPGRNINLCSTFLLEKCEIYYDSQRQSFERWNHWVMERLTLSKTIYRFICRAHVLPTARINFSNVVCLKINTDMISYIFFFLFWAYGCKKKGFTWLSSTLFYWSVVTCLLVLVCQIKWFAIDFLGHRDL